MYSNRRLHYCSLFWIFSATFLLSSSRYPIEAFVVVGATASSSSVSMKMSILSNAELDKDTCEFHQYAASEVDLSSCHVSSSSVLSVVRSVRNWELNARQNYLYRFHLGSSDDDMLLLPPIPLDSSVQMYLPSPSGRKTIIIKNEKEDTDERIVEVWQGSSLTRKINVGGKGSLHGKVINDAVGFGVPTWSPDEEFLLYSAERRPPTTVPFWTADDKNDNVRGGQNVLGKGVSESWGETYHKQEAILDLYVLNLSTGRVGRVRNVPDEESVALGQAVWHPKGSKIAFTGWEADQPKRLGMVYCRNRASKIYESKVDNLLQELANPDGNEDDEDETSDSNYSCVSSDLHYSRSPRYVGENLVFLGSEIAFVTHDASMGLYSRNEKRQTTENIIPVFEDPSSDGASVSDLGFPGLFLGQLPMNCDLGNNYLVTTTLWGSFQRVIRIDIENDKIQLIDIPQLDKHASHSLCTVGPNGDLVISETSCNKPARLWVVKGSDLIQDTQSDAIVADAIVANANRVASFAPIATSTFSPVDQPEEKAYTMQVLTIDSESMDGAESSPIQALLLLPKKVKEKVPMIVVPHGGPHSCSASAFSPGVAYLATKYAVLLPNYRGSIGFGQGPLNSLPTRIGRVDVQDVMLSARYAIENFSVIDRDRVGICGGSHGGFLTAHCTSQYPEFFKAGKREKIICSINLRHSIYLPFWNCILTNRTKNPKLQ